MTTRLEATLTVVLLAVAAAAPAVRAADAMIEGTVASTTLTKCEFKPGTCEGSLVLERKEGGKPSQVTVKVPKGTAIKKGNEGEKVAKAIEVKPAKP